MKKLRLGLVVVGAAMALRPIVKRRMTQMREHCKQMAGHCKEMMDAQGGGGGEAASREAMPRMMRKHCASLAAEHEDQHETVWTA
jgi:hypothetical protein